MKEYIFGIFFVLNIINEFDRFSNDFVKNICSYFDKFEVHRTIFYDLILFIHVVKLETYESKIKGKL